MAFPGCNVAATMPRLSSLVGRQSADDSTNLSGGEDKWAIGNNTDSSPDQYRWIFIVDQTILVSLLVGSSASVDDLGAVRRRTVGLSIDV